LQGSEFSDVYVYQDFCASSWNPARWLYTAITRSSKNVTFIPNPQFNYAIDTDRFNFNFDED
jgi:hypothetical protein